MKIAIVADWLPTFGGAEHVLAEFHALWPEAPIFTTVAKHGSLGPLDTATMYTSKLQPWFKLLGKHQYLLPWMPAVVESFDLRDVDIICSSSHAVGKGIIPPSNAIHICYCHTPMRYAWIMEEEYLQDFGIPVRFRGFIRKALKKIRRWDLTTAKRVDVFLANSTTTQERIARIYGRESTVVHPPVHDRFFDVPMGSKKESEYFLAIGRLVPYKRFDLLIQTANTLGIKLQIAGAGHDLARLKKLAGPTVEFLGFVPDEALPGLYAEAKALLFPQFEDAGVVPLEAQACGTPVIAYKKGGALDTVQEGKTGLFFAEQTVESLTKTLQDFEKTIFDRKAIREHAKKFSSKNFRNKMSEIVAQYTP